MSLAIFKTIVQKGKTFHGVINKQEGWGQVLGYFNHGKINVFKNANSSRGRVDNGLFFTQVGGQRS